MARPGPAIDPLLGKTLAERFEIIERIGEGGMGVVYRARQISVDRPVAIKVLNSQVAGDPTWVQRFINEAKACSKLQHPNTIRLVDFGQSKEGMLFIAMEFLDGLNLRQAIERSGPMPAARVTKILLQACQSLAEAHAFGIIHRDIKPDNLFIINMPGSPDFVKVLDFSVAKLRQQGSAAQTQAGVVFGTPQYMSPEQGRGLPLDARSDIYALGIVAYEMLSGKVPFSSQNPMEVLAMHVRTPPPPLHNVPARVANIVMRCLAKDANQRFQTVEQMVHECQAALGELSSSMAAAPPPAAAAVKTMFAPGGGAMGAPPPAAPVLGAEAKTMMAGPGMGPSPFVPPMPVTATPSQMTAPAVHLPPPMPAAGGGGEKKTMLLENSEGVVSFAREGLAAPRAGTDRVPREDFGAGAGADTAGAGGSSALFWVICIVCGVGIGVLAYFVVTRVT